jgi:hypothetical protein
VLTAALEHHQGLQNSRPMAIFKIYYFFSPTPVSRRILLPTALIKTKIKIKIFFNFACHHLFPRESFQNN